MRTYYRILLLMIIALSAACAPSVPQSPAVQPPAAATATAAPEQPTPALPTAAAPTAEPTVEPTAAPAADLSQYNLSAQVVESPDQAWQVEAVRGEITAVSGEATTANADAQDYNRITAARRDGSLRWVYEAYTNHGLGEGVPSGFTFSADGKYLYFYDRIAADGGCGQIFQGFLRRMDLTSGQVEPVEAFNREGRFFLAPDGRTVAEVAENQVLLTSLESGARQAIAFEMPAGSEVGYADLLWSEDARWLAFDVLENYGRCESRPMLLDTIIVDIAANSARPLSSPENVAGAMEWLEPGVLLVQTGRENPARVDVRTGQAEEFPVDRDALTARQAETALRRFLSFLYQGRFEPSLYAEAEPLFGGWELLSARYPTMRFTDNAAILRYACEQDAFRCYPVRQVVFTGKEPTGTEGTDLYRFQVEFLGLDGAPLVVNGQSVFDFTLEMNFPERTQIFQMPPLEE